MKYIRNCVIKQIEIAEDFYEAYKHCFASNNQKHIVAIPAFVNGFLACEIYLKYILKANEKDAKGHDLAKLFKQLPQKMQDRIEKEFSEKAEWFYKQYKISFDELLDKISFGFEFWRYIYEDKNAIFEDRFPFAFSECFLQVFLPIIDKIAKGAN